MRERCCEDVPVLSRGRGGRGRQRINRGGKSGRARQLLESSRNSQAPFGRRAGAENAKLDAGLGQSGALKRGSPRHHFELLLASQDDLMLPKEPRRGLYVIKLGFSGGHIHRLLLESDRSASPRSSRKFDRRLGVRERSPRPTMPHCHDSRGNQYGLICELRRCHHS